MTSARNSPETPGKPPRLANPKLVCHGGRENRKRLPADLRDEVRTHPARAGKALARTFGKGPRPLLVSIRVLALALAAAPLPGCCAIAREMCAIQVAKTPVRAQRDTPLGAVDFLIDAFNRRAPGEIFETLHPDYIETAGGFSASQFATGYERFEPEFRADGVRLQSATKDPPKWKDGLASVYVHDATASVWLVFRNRPGTRVLVDDEYDDEIRDAPTAAGIGDLVSVEGGAISLRRPVSLRGRGADLDPAQIRRVEIYQDWRLYDVREPRNIRFVDKMIEQMKGAQ